MTVSFSPVNPTDTELCIWLVHSISVHRIWLTKPTFSTLHPINTVHFIPSRSGFQSNIARHYAFSPLYPLTAHLSPSTTQSNFSTLYSTTVRFRPLNLNGTVVDDKICCLELFMRRSWVVLFRLVFPSAVHPQQSSHPPGPVRAVGRTMAVPWSRPPSTWKPSRPWHHAV